MNVVAEQPADWDTAKAQAATENIITGNPNLKAVFASNDNMALGAVEALKSANMLDKVMVVGFDANPNAAEAILAGDMTASVAQNPMNMGRFGVENALKVKKGETHRRGDRHRHRARHQGQRRRLQVSRRAAPDYRRCLRVPEAPASGTPQSGPPAEGDRLRRRSIPVSRRRTAFARMSVVSREP